MTNLNVGIVGCGFIGGALKQWLENHNPNCNVLISDPPKGYNDDLSNCDIVFVSIHIPTESDNTQDLTLLKNIILNLPDIPVFIRTTLLPTTTDQLAEELNKKIYFMPEFLTQRTAYEDFCTQKMIFTGEIELLKRVFPNREFIQMSSQEAEITKYTHNVFGALKVTYFNGIYQLAEKLGCDYNKIHQGIFVSDYINPMHTQVPGPDGHFGYGGKCFPKDVDAFWNFTKDSELGNLLKIVRQNNELYRDE